MCLSEPCNQTIGSLEGFWARGWLSGLPTPAVVLCAGACPAFALDTPCLLLALQKWELGFEYFFFVSCCASFGPAAHVHSYF